MSQESDGNSVELERGQWHLSVTVTQIISVEVYPQKDWVLL